MVHLLRPHSLFIPSLLSHGHERHSPKNSPFAQNNIACRSLSTGITHEFPSPWHTWDMCGEASPFECVGRRGMHQCWVLTPLFFLQETSSTPTARLPTAARPCPARWPWSTTSSSSPAESKRCPGLLWGTAGLKGGRTVQTETICGFGVVSQLETGELSQSVVTPLSLQVVLPRGR